MREGVLWRNILRVLSSFAALAALCTRADVTVSVTASSLSPNPVYIVTGETVYWTDADGNGPYGIYADDGSWSTFTDTSGITFDQTGTFGYNDDPGDFGTIYVTPNIPPSVTITSPTNNAVFSAPASFDFTALASDTDSDGLSDVEFYVGDNLVSDIFFPPPFTTPVTNLPPGTYTLTAIAYDNGGLTATNSLSITLRAVLPPALVATRVAYQIIISWNTNNAIGFSLQSTTNLASATSWAPVTNTPTSSGGQLLVTNPIAGPKRFFRLSNQ